MALSRVVSEIFNVEKCRDLEIVVKGHSRSLRVVPCDSCINSANFMVLSAIAIKLLPIKSGGK